MPRDIPAAYVYRLHSPKGKLVYVGLTTGRVNDRLRVHRNRSTRWWHKVDPNLTTATAYATVEEADYARKQAIRTEAPSDNVHHSYVVKVIAASAAPTGTIAQNAADTYGRRGRIQAQQGQQARQDELMGGYIKREPTPPPVRGQGQVFFTDAVIVSAEVSGTGQEFYGTVSDPDGIAVLGRDGVTVVDVVNERHLRLDPQYHSAEEIARFLGVTIDPGTAATPDDDTDDPDPTPLP